MENKLDKFFRDKLEDQVPLFDEKYWGQAERMMDAREDKSSRKFGWFWTLPLFLLGGMFVAYLFMSSNVNVSSDNQNEKIENAISVNVNDEEKVKNAKKNENALSENTIAKVGLQEEDVQVKLDIQKEDLLKKSPKSVSKANLKLIKLEESVNDSNLEVVERRKETFYVKKTEEIIDLKTLRSNNKLINRGIKDGSESFTQKENQENTKLIKKSDLDIFDKKNTSLDGKFLNSMATDDETVFYSTTIFGTINMYWNDLQISQNNLQKEVKISDEKNKKFERNAKKWRFGLSAEAEIFETQDDSPKNISAIKAGIFAQYCLNSKWNLGIDFVGSRRTAEYEFQKTFAESFGFGKKINSYFISSNQQYFAEPAFIISRKLGFFHKLGLGIGGDFLLSANADLYSKEQNGFFVTEGEEAQDDFTTSLITNGWWDKKDARKWSSFIQVRYEYQMNKNVRFFTKVYIYKNNLLYLDPAVDYSFKSHLKTSLGVNWIIN